MIHLLWNSSAGTFEVELKALPRKSRSQKLIHRKKFKSNI